MSSQRNLTVDADKPQANASIHATNTTSSDPETVSGSIVHRPPLAKGKTAQPSSGLLAKIGGLRQASSRPLPTETGNGTYITRKVQTGLREDLKRITWKGTLQSCIAIAQSIPCNGN